MVTLNVGAEFGNADGVMDEQDLQELERRKTPLDAAGDALLAMGFSYAFASLKTRSCGYGSFLFCLA